MLLGSTAKKVGNHCNCHLLLQNSAPQILKLLVTHFGEGHYTQARYSVIRLYSAHTGWYMHVYILYI